MAWRVQPTSGSPGVGCLWLSEPDANTDQRRDPQRQQGLPMDRTDAKFGRRLRTGTAETLVRAAHRTPASSDRLRATGFAQNLRCEYSVEVAAAEGQASPLRRSQ